MQGKRRTMLLRWCVRSWGRCRVRLRGGVIKGRCVYRFGVRGERNGGVNEVFLCSEYFPKPRFFAGFGTTPNIPRYLRYKGKIVNHGFGIRDVCVLVRDVWTEKSIYERIEGCSIEVTPTKKLLVCVVFRCSDFLFF